MLGVLLIGDELGLGDLGFGSGDCDGGRGFGSEHDGWIRKARFAFGFAGGEGEGTTVLTVHIDGSFRVPVSLGNKKGPRQR